MEKRAKYAKLHPEMSNLDLTKILSKKYKELPEKKKVGGGQSLGINKGGGALDSGSGQVSRAEQGSWTVYLAPSHPPTLLQALEHTFHTTDDPAFPKGPSHVGSHC